MTLEAEFNVESPHLKIEAHLFILSQGMCLDLQEELGWNIILNKYFEKMHLQVHDWKYLPIWVWSDAASISWDLALYALMNG